MFDVLELSQVDAGADEAALIERIAVLERMKAAAAAGQARAAARLDGLRRSSEEALGVSAARCGRGVSSEVALARRDSPSRGNRHLGFAKALVHEMPHTLAALETGALSEWRATLIVRESACLAVEDREALDAELCADVSTLDGWGDARIAAAAKAIAYRLDPHAVVERAANAAKDRRVTIRPAPDTMTIVSALLPVTQGVAVYAALKRAADSTFDERSRGQVMSDVLVERVTGRAAEVPVPVEVAVVITDDALFGDGTAAAVIDGHGPIPAEVARQLIVLAATDHRSWATLRRLYRRPKGGALVAMESRARKFPKGLARFIATRDQRCRTPFCDAPLRHTDHATPHARGGATSAVNGNGRCERCNYIKELPGWRTRTWLAANGTHTAEDTTPTGATYRSTAPPAAGIQIIDLSEIETHLGEAIVKLHAA